MARVFISFSMRDLGFVREIARGLESAGHEVWIFFDQVKTDESPVIDGEVGQPYRQAIENCDVFILFVSNHSIRSRNVTAELRYAFNIKKPLLPVRLDYRYDDPRVTQLLLYLDPADFTRSHLDAFGGLIRRLGDLPYWLRHYDTWSILLSILPLEEPLTGEPPTEISEKAYRPLQEPITITPETAHGTAKKTMAKNEMPEPKAKRKPKPKSPKSSPKAGKPKAAASEKKKKPKAKPVAKARKLKINVEGFDFSRMSNVFAGIDVDEVRRALADSGPGSKKGGGRSPKFLKAERIGDSTRGGGDDSRHTVRVKPPSPATPPAPQPRYANAVLLSGDGKTPLNASQPLKRGTPFRLRLDIGKLSQLSAVVDAVPFPSHRLPPDIWLDVMVTSTDFQVGRKKREVGLANVAEGRFFLPGDGSAAKAEGKSKYMTFHLRAPTKNKLARARVTYYYRNHPVQSQLLLAAIGGKASRFTVTTDYTLSEDLTGLERLPRRRQLSILTNDNDEHSHQFIVRAAQANGSLLDKPLTFELNSTGIGRVVRSLRDALYNIAPTKRARRIDQLKADLKALAPLGWGLFTEAGMSRYLQTLYPLLMKKDTALVVQVTRPNSSRFVFPWGFIYDIPLDSQQEFEYCSLVEEWDGESPLITGETHHCPKGKHKANTLCPFGFWGYRYAIEQLSRTDAPPTPIAVPDGFNMVMAETQYSIDKDLLEDHAREVGRILKRNFPGARLQEGLDLKSVKSLLGQDTPLVYFYCHGERPRSDSPDTVLGVGRSEMLYSKDFISWIAEWWDFGEGRKIWDAVRPLIFINACHSAEVNPESLVTYLDAFIETGHASGVVGTEVRVNPTLAMDAANQFFTSFLGGDSAGQALHKMQLDFLRSGNLFGLVYTPYFWSDLTLKKV